MAAQLNAGRPFSFLLTKNFQRVTNVKMSQALPVEGQGPGVVSPKTHRTWRFSVSEGT